MSYSFISLDGKWTYMAKPESNFVTPMFTSTVVTTRQSKHWHVRHASGWRKLTVFFLPVVPKLRCKLEFVSFFTFTSNCCLKNSQREDPKNKKGSSPIASWWSRMVRALHCTRAHIRPISFSKRSSLSPVSKLYLQQAVPLKHACIIQLLEVDVHQIQTFQICQFGRTNGWIFLQSWCALTCALFISIGCWWRGQYMCSQLCIFFLEDLMESNQWAEHLKSSATERKLALFSGCQSSQWSTSCCTLSNSPLCKSPDSSLALLERQKFWVLAPWDVGNPKVSWWPMRNRLGQQPLCEIRNCSKILLSSTIKNTLAFCLLEIDKFASQPFLNDSIPCLRWRLPDNSKHMPRY